MLLCDPRFGGEDRFGGELEEDFGIAEDVCETDLLADGFEASCALGH